MNINAILNREYIGLLRRVQCGPAGNCCLYGTDLSLAVGPEITDSSMSIQVVASAKPGLAIDWRGLPVMVTSWQGATSYIQAMDRSGSARFEDLPLGEYEVAGSLLGKVWPDIPLAAEDNVGHINVFYLGDDDSQQRIVLKIKDERNYEVAAPDLGEGEAIQFAIVKADSGLVYQSGAVKAPDFQGDRLQEKSYRMAADGDAGPRLDLACWVMPSEESVELIR